MKISARNQLGGTVVRVNKGPINSTVSIDVGGGNVVTAMITTQSVTDLGLTEGSKATAFIKASDVIVGTD